MFFNQYLVRSLCVIFILLGVVSHASASVGEFNLNQPFDLGVKDRFKNDREDIFVSFTKVISDSRCPRKMVCVWEGDVEVELKIEHENTRIHAHLTLGGKKDATVTFGDKGEFELELLDVSPAGGKMYTATVEVKGAVDDEDDICPTDYSPVCAIQERVCLNSRCSSITRLKTYSNQCAADRENAIFLREGECGRFEGRM